MRLSKLLLMTLIASSMVSSSVYGLDDKFKRNGEVYMSVEGLKAIRNGTVINGAEDGIYRLNNPEGLSGLHYGSNSTAIVNGIPDLYTFAVDLYRKIYTMSEPDEVNVSADWTIKRQVLDGTEALQPTSNETRENSNYNLTGMKKVPILNPAGYGININADAADYGCHYSGSHDDYRSGRQTSWWTLEDKRPKINGVYVGDPTGSPIYRFNDGSYNRKRTGSGSSGSNCSNRYLEDDGNITINSTGNSGSIRLRVLQGTLTTAPSDPQSYMPCATSSQAIFLPVYQGKRWYEIPNGSWFSSWRARYNCSFGNTWGYENPGLSGRTSGSNRVQYQVYCDYCDVKEKDWRLVKYQSDDTSTFKDYSIFDSGDSFGKTTTEQWARAVIGACLDACGGASGNANIPGSKYLFDVTFMPDNASDVTVYSYNRKEEANTGKVSSKPNSTVKIFSDTVSIKNLTASGIEGLGRSDTRWIGVSKGKTNDYLYMLGTSQIKSWLNTASSTYIAPSATIDAVTVSNQWNEEGGIVFAYDKTNGFIYKFILDENGVPTVLPRIDVKGIQNLMKSNGEIDDIATDGFGNLYLSATYPSNSSLNLPTKLNWTYDDAYCVEVAQTTGTVKLTFKFKADFRKTVRKVSATGEDLSEIGSKFITTKTYYSIVNVPPSVYNASSLPSEIAKYNSLGKCTGVSTLLTSLGISQTTIVADDPANSDITGTSKLSVINTPTPPEVLHLGNTTDSYLDICGPYENYPVPGKDDQGRYITNQYAGISAPTPGKVYYFMVENYPIYGFQRNPNVESLWDPDGDGRRSGFINTIIEASGSLDIDYHWSVYRVREFDPIKNPNGDPASGSIKLMNRFDKNFAVMYAVNPGIYIITCSAQYSYWDYDTVQFGQTISAWKTSGQAVKTKRAYASGNDWNNGITTESAKTKITGFVNDAFTLYGTPVSYNLNNIVDFIRNNELASTGLDINNADDSKRVAVQMVVVSGVGAPPPETGTALVERHNIDPKGTGTTHRNTTNNGLNEELSTNLNGANPSKYYKWASVSSSASQKFHGLKQGNEYYWRISPASQSVFLSENIQIGDDAYNYIADMIEAATDPFKLKESPNLVFKRGESKIEWFKDSNGNPEPLSVIASLYDHNNNRVKSWSSEEGGMLETYSQGGKDLYKYIKLGSDLPVTDPKEYRLDIQFARMFNCTMYFTSSDGVQETSIALDRPIRMTVDASVKLMVMDSEAPRFEIAATTVNGVQVSSDGSDGSNVIEGQTGKKLTGIIGFTISDNNASETTAVGDCHSLWQGGNASYNASITANINKMNNPAENLKPVYKKNSGYVRIIYSLPTESSASVFDSSKSDVASYTINNSNYNEFENSDNTYYGYSGALSGLSTAAITPHTTGLLKRNPSNGTQGSGRIKYTYSYNLGTLNHTLPKTYANNTAGYNPIKFKIEARDCSGNKLERQYLQSVVDIIDTVPPIPFARIKEFKDNKTVVYPKILRGGTSGTDIASTSNSTYAAELRFGVSTQGFTTSGTMPAMTSGNYAVISSPKKVDELKHIDPSEYSTYSVATNSFSIEEGVQVYIRGGAVDNSGGAKVTKLYYEYADVNGTKQSVTLSYPNPVATSSLQVGKAVTFYQSNDQDFTYLAPLKITAKDNARGKDKYRYNTNNGYVDFVIKSPSDKGADKALSTTIETSIPIFGTKTNIRTIEKYTKPNN